MARIATTQSTVLARVVARLIAEIDELSESNCYEVAEPEPTVERSHNLFCQVSIGDGRYDESAIDGAGFNQVMESGLVWVTIFSRMKLDQAQHAKQALYDASRGLLTLKKSVLAALSGHDLVTEGGDSILVNYMSPTSSTRPLKDWDKFSTVAVAFTTDFEWNLT